MFYEFADTRPPNQQSRCLAQPKYIFNFKPTTTLRGLERYFRVPGLFGKGKKRFTLPAYDSKADFIQADA